jgi:hypothetical protein
MVAKTRKSKGAKAGTRAGAEKVKVSIILSADVDFRLSVHAAALRMDRSAVVNQVLTDALKRFTVSDRERSSSAEPDANVSVESAA